MPRDGSTAEPRYEARPAPLDTLALEPDNAEAKRRLTLLDERR